MGDTGAANDKYALGSVQLHLSSYTESDDSVRISIYGTDTGGNLASSVYVLENPATIINEALNTFTAPANATLDEETTYFVIIEVPRGLVVFGDTSSSSEDSTPASGWSIKDGGAFFIGNTGFQQTNTVRIAIRGPSTASTDATLSALALTNADGGAAIALTPTFDSATEAYTASVAYGVSQVTVAPTANDSGATVAHLDAMDMAATDANGGVEGHQVDLAPGAATVMKVKVTAEDGSTEKTYTVTVTRASPAVLVSNAGQTAS